jgi:hypothetical protein
MPTNVEKLQAAEILPTPHKLSPGDVTLINQLPQPEVDAVVAVKTALGKDFIKRNTSLIL